MLNPLKWKYEDQARLLFAAAFGALLGFANGYSHGWFNLLGAVVVGGRPAMSAFWGNSGHRGFRVSCLLLTQSGHWPAFNIL
jgi:hypothetical protein